MRSCIKLKSLDETVLSCKQIAIIGATASGKTALSIEMAHKHNAIIFSIDSLAIYKEMDIVSAKPSKEEQDGILHIGIDALEVPEHFSAAKVITLYKEAVDYANRENKNLIIIGGSSFYLKTLLTGLSEQPEYTVTCKEKTAEMLKDLSKCYSLLKEIDPLSIETVASNDSYRLEKLLLLYNQTGMIPSEYYKTHQAKPIIDSLEIFELSSDREVLRERIALRTKLMLKMGLIDEIAMLEKSYGRAHQSMKAIGVIETLQYLDNEISNDELSTLITTHTAQLAKRQTTFNRTQFESVYRSEKNNLKQNIDLFFSQ
jgi:tRNA dimethylallyltransferase